MILQNKTKSLDYILKNSSIGLHILYVFYAEYILKALAKLFLCSKYIWLTQYAYCLLTCILKSYSTKYRYLNMNATHYLYFCCSSTYIKCVYLYIHIYSSIYIYIVVHIHKYVNIFFIHLPMNTWIVSIFWVLRILLQWTWKYRYLIFWFHFLWLCKSRIVGSRCSSIFYFLEESP